VSSANRILDAVLATPSSSGFHALASAGAKRQGLKHELVDAQVETLRMYLEKRPPEKFVAALDRLIECTRASFREEEELMECLTSVADPRHRARHDAVIAQLESLRACVSVLDRGRLLAQLIVVDRELTSHISGAVQAPSSKPQLHAPERVAAIAQEDEALAHH